VDHVAVTGFKAWVKRDEQGQFNFRDLLGRQPSALGLAGSALAAPMLASRSSVPAEDAAQAPGTRAASGEGGAHASLLRLSPLSTAAAQQAVARTDFQIDIAGLDLKNGEIHLYDSVSGAVGRIEQLDVNTGRVTFNQAFDAALKGKLIGEYPEADASLAGQALLQLNPNDQTYSAQKLNLQINGKLGQLDAKSMAVRGNLAYNAFSQMLNVSNLDVQVQGDVTGKEPIKGLETSLAVPQLKVDRSQAELRVERMSYRAKGQLPDRAFDIAFDAPNLAISPEAAQGEPVQGTLKFTKPDSTLGVSLSLDGLGGNATRLTLKELKVQAGLKEGERLVQLNMTSPAVWDVFRKTGGLSAMKGDIRVDDAALPGGSFEFPFIGSLQADLIKDRLDSEIDAVLSGSKLNFKLNATQLADPKVVFALKADKLDFNTLFPPAPVPAAPAAATAKPAAEQAKPAAKPPAKPPAKPAAGKGDESSVPDLAFLAPLDVTGTFDIGELKVQQVEASAISARLRALEGKLEIADIKASLYDGSLAGSLMADAQNRLGARLTLSDVSVGPLLQAYAQEGRLSGKGTVKVDLSSSGKTSAAVEAGLSGQVQLRLRDGAIRGIDFSQTLGEVNDVVRNLFSGQLPSVMSRIDMARVTDFSALDADVDFEQGQGTIRKLNVATPMLRITQGTPASLDLVNDQFDMLVDVRVVKTASGQSGKDLADLQGVTVPVRISGPFATPSYQVQWKEINSKQIKEAVGEGLLDLMSNQVGKTPQKGAPAKPGATAKPADPVKSIGEAIKGLLGQ
jgi:AsmA protein